MTVFKCYFKMVKAYIPMIIIYTVIFTAISTFAIAKNNDYYFVESKPNVAIINHGDTSVFYQTFEDYVSKNTNVVELKDEENDLKDALFYRKVDYILLIPPTFGEDMMTGKKPDLEVMNIPDSPGSVYASMLLNRYLNIANLYIKSGMSDKTIAMHIERDLQSATKVTVKGGKEVSALTNANFYYNFLNYTLLVLALSVIGMIVSNFNYSQLKKRNLVSKTSYRQINRSLLLGNICLTLMLWLLFVIISIGLYGGAMFAKGGLLLILNSFIFCISSVTIGVFIGSFALSKDALNGVINVVALGSSFICGAFVPQYLLNDFVLGIAKFFPSYWFVSGNNQIVLLSNYNFETLSPILIDMGIMIAFGFIFILLNNIVSRFKLKNN